MRGSRKGRFWGARPSQASPVQICRFLVSLDIGLLTTGIPGFELSLKDSAVRNKSRPPWGAQ